MTVRDIPTTIHAIHPGKYDPRMLNAGLRRQPSMARLDSVIETRQLVRLPARLSLVHPVFTALASAEFAPINHQFYKTDSQAGLKRPSPQ